MHGGVTSAAALQQSLMWVRQVSQAAEVDPRQYGHVDRRGGCQLTNTCPKTGVDMPQLCQLLDEDENLRRTHLTSVGPTHGISIQKHVVQMDIIQTHTTVSRNLIVSKNVKYHVSLYLIMVMCIK